MPEPLNTHGLVCDFGRHKGVPYTQVPVHYLKWMVNVRHGKAGIAAAELERRGTVTPDLDVSGHAIDRASLSCRKIWHTNRGDNEGLHAWLVRVAREALDRNDTDAKGRYHHVGMRFAFELDGVWPVLKTVMPEKKQAK